MKLHSEHQRFFYRVAGVVVNGGRVLAHKDELSDFWVLPGGSCEHGEDSMLCLEREFCEELDAKVQVGRLLWVAESFFRFRGWECHELGLYYQVELLTPGHAEVARCITQALRTRRRRSACRARRS